MNMLMKSNMQGDPAEITRFLELLFKHCKLGEGYIALRAFRQEVANEDDNKPIHSEWRKFDKDLPQHAADVATTVAHFLQANRAVFCPPVCLFKDGSTAKEANVLVAPAISVELDSRPQDGLETLRSILGDPTCVVASGGVWQGQDKLHLHWRLSKAASGPDLPMLKKVRRLATDIVAADPTNVPVNHPLRWPGSWHTKGEPRFCRIVDDNPDAEVNLYEAYVKLKTAAEAIGLQEDVSTELNVEGFKTKEPWTADALNAAAKRIDNPAHENPEHDWHHMNKVMMAFFDASHASEDGLVAFNAFSEKHPKHNWEYNDARWSHMKTSPPTRTSAGSLVYLARQADPHFYTKVGDPALYIEGEPPKQSLSNKDAKPDDSLFEILDLEQIEQLPPPTFLIDRHIPERSVGFLYGDPGTGKSFVALDMALHIAYSLSAWHGDEIGRIDEEAAVVYLAGEGASGMRTRAKAWRQQHSLDQRSKRFGLLGGTVNFMSDEDGQKLVRSVRDYTRRMNKPIAMIVVDTVSRAMPGADENTQKEMTLFIKACDRLKDEFGCAVMGVHHANKQGDMRGSSVLLGAGDFVLKLERKKGAAVGHLLCEKQKDGPDGWKDAYRFDVVELGEKESSLVPVRLSGADAGIVPAALEDAVLGALDAAWVSGEPWGRTARAQDRHAVRKMTRDFGMDGHDAQLKLEEWLASGLVVEDLLSKKEKKKGLRLVSFAEENRDAESVFE